MEQFEIIAAAFTPRRRDDLRPGAEAWFGRITKWQAAWLIEDGDYAGEWSMTPAGRDRFEAPFAWVPSGDLTPTPLALYKSTDKEPL